MKNNIKYITQLLNKAFLPFGKNSTIKTRDYAYYLSKTAQANTYVETHSKKADSLHLRIKNSYEECIRDSYFSLIKKLIKYKRFGRITIAIDITEEIFYGKTRNFYIFHCGKKPKDDNAEFHYIVASIANKKEDEKIPIMALPVTLGYNKAKLVDQLLSYCTSLFRVNLVLLDRGFSSGEVIRIIQQKRISYLILAKKYGFIKHMLESIEKIHILKHEITYNKDKTIYKVKTNLVLIKDVADYDWCFYTNLRLSDALLYVITYKQRWRIETNFRVEDEARIKSKSINHTIRYFYFIFSLLMHTLWLLFSRDIPFKRFLIQTYEVLFCELLEVEWVGIT